MNASVHKRWEDTQVVFWTWVYLILSSSGQILWFERLLMKSEKASSSCENESCEKQTSWICSHWEEVIVLTSVEEGKRKGGSKWSEIGVYLLNSSICLVSMDTLLCWLLTSCWCVSDELWMEGWHEELCVKHVHTSGYVSPLWQEWSRARLLTAEVRRISLLPSWGLRSWDSVGRSPELRSKGAESWGWVMSSNYNQEKMLWGKMTSILSVVIASN